ncbi:DUF305 domain-containing protein [Micromonospora sp. NBC_01796]|uniref:DUF305 domain-containing protein n=1 Tax=Micromonospora sp. NBC_01796 TaxID=2975987 RepID=UPI002DD7C148|nr:DUF305 domain-containing protein [Micromonospora sp. NBC_01796]WSA83851.1 DUF305 domain-containing protein [Micromonospora sp. NBC_01796]
MTRLLRITATLAVLAVGLLIGERMGPRPVGPPGEGSAAVGFCRDMAVHHQQAVELSLVVRDRSTDDDVRRLAYDVLTTQAAQRGMMLGWLTSWGYSASAARPPMAWMAMPGSPAGPPMPGMATREQVAALERAGPGTADVMYLRLLIAHHLGGVHMTDGLLRPGVPGTPPEVRWLAEAMRNSQRAEIGALRDMLAVRAAPPRRDSIHTGEPGR